MTHYEERGVKLDRKRQIIAIQDEFISRQKSSVWWSMHTQAEIRISEDGKTAKVEMMPVQEKGKSLKRLLKW